MRTWIKATGLAVATGVSASVYYVIQPIQPAPQFVTSKTLIERFTKQEKQHWDVYEAKVSDPVDVNKFASCFFRSPVFQAERIVLQILQFGKNTDDEIKQMKFVPGESMSLFQVMENAPNQILFRWGKSVNGHTWLSVSDDGHTLHFGSTFQCKNKIIEWIIPPHLIYGRVVLASARYQLEKEKYQ